jgi:hypothetical protein
MHYQGLEMPAIMNVLKLSPSEFIIYPIDEQNRGVTNDGTKSYSKQKMLSHQL